MQIKKFILFIIVSFMLASCSSGPEVQWEKFTDEAFNQAASANQPAIVYFYAAWCRPCQKLKEDVFKDERVIQGLEGFRRLKADVSFREKPENIELHKRFRVSGLPTIIFFNTREPGKEVARFSGTATAESFLNYLERIR